MNNKQEYKLNLFKPSGEYMGELDVNNLALFLTREGFSNITFDIAAKIDNKTNKRLYDIYDQYEVELILRNKTYRFIITDTPANMNDDGSLTYSYTAISTDFELTKKHIFHWEGIKKYTYWRRVDYKTAGQKGFGPQIITPINLQKIDGVFDSQEVEIYEVRKTEKQERESLLVDMTGIELNLNQMGEGTFVIVEDNGVAKAKIAPFSDSRKEQIPDITEIYYKIYDKIAFADSDIEYNELLNKYQFDNAEFYSTPTGKTKEFDGLLYQEEEYYTTIGVTIKDIVDGTIHKDTEWKVNINEDIAEEKRSDIEINNLNAYQLIETIAKSFDVIFVVDSSNREISFYKKYDDIPNTIQNNLVIDFQTYLKAISKDITTDEVVTNIIASGSDGISTTFVSPTGRNWENYDYYLDSYLMFREDGEFLEHNTNIETITDIKDLKFIYTKDFSSRWLSHSTAEKLGLWSITKDYYYRLLNNLPQRANTSKITGNDIYRNLAERREKLLKELVLNETKADQYYAQELHYKNLATIVDNEEIFNEEDLKDTNSETYARYLKQNERSANYLKISNENKLSKERFEKIIQELEYLTMGYHKEIYDSKPPRGTNVYKLMEDLRILFDKKNPQWKFTPKELKEIEKIKKDVLWNDDSIDNEVDLFLAANDYLLENNKPKVTIGIDIVDILAAAEVEIDKDNLFLGNYIYVRFEEFNIDTKAQISSLNINFEENTIDMEITTLKHFSKGITHKVIQKINGLSVESKNITEYYKDYNKRSGEESKKLADIFGDDYNADTNTISGGGTGVDEKGNPVHDIVINGEGIKTSNMKIDAATDNIIIDTDAGTTIQLKNGMLGLVGKGKQGDQEIKTRVMMSTTQGFRIDVMKEDELGYQSVDNKFWADLNGNLTVRGRIYATGGKIGSLSIAEIDKIPTALEGLGEGIESSKGEVLNAVAAEEERAKLAESTAQEAAKEAERLAGIAQAAAKEADELSKAADELAKAAEQAATSAQEKAEGADAKAGEAKGTANQAVIDAASAQGTADQATIDAEEADKKAEAAAKAAEEATKAAEAANNALAFANIDGKKIAGWITDSHQFKSESSGGFRVVLDSGTKDNLYRIWAGADEGKDAPFSVQSDGTIYATKGTIGNLTITAFEKLPSDISEAKASAGEAVKTAGDAKTAAEAADKKAGESATAAGESAAAAKLADEQAKAAAEAAELADEQAKAAAAAAVLADEKAKAAATEAGGAKTAAEESAAAAGQSATEAGGAKTAAEESAAAAVEADKKAKAAAEAAVEADKKAKAAAEAAEAAKAAAEKAKKDLEDTLAGLEIKGKTIAGWTTAAHRFSANSTGGYGVSLDSGTKMANGVTTPYRIWAGAVEGQGAPFSVQSDGTVRATKAEIQGKVTIDNGSIMIGAQTSWFEHSRSSYPERFSYVDSVVIDGLTIYRWLSDDEAHNPNQPQYLLTETRSVGIGDVVWGYQMIDDGYYEDFDYPNGDPAQRIIINVSKGHNYNFVVDKNGVMNAKGAVIEGKITSESGNIGGWNIGKTSLTGDSTRVGMGTGNHFLWAGNISPTQGNFYVSKSGEMTAKRGTIGSFHIGHYENGSWENIPISSSDDALIKKTRFNFGRTIVESQLDGYGFMSKSGLQAARVGPGIISLFTGYSMDMTGPDPGMTSALPYLSAIPTVSLDAEGLTIIEDFTFYASKMPDKPAPKFKVTGYNRSGERYSALMVNYAGISASVASTEFSSKAIKKDISKIDDSQFYNFLEIIDPKKYKLREDDSEGISIIIEDEIEKNLPFKDILFGKKEFNEMVYNDIDSVPDWIREQSKNFDILETLEDGRVVFNPLSYNVNSMIGVLLGTVKNLHNRVKELESKLNI